MFHNLTNQEYFRLHGTLPPDRIEELLSIIGAAEDLFQCQFYASDYGRSELIDAIKCIDPTGKHVSSRRVKKKFAPSGQ